MAAGQRKLEAQWTADERKVANLDQHLKSLIMLVLFDDQMNSVINCLTEKSTWDDLILYHEGPSNVKESRVIDLKLCYNTFKFKEGESLTQAFTRYKALMNELDFQDSSDDEEDTRSSHEYLNDLEEEYQAKALLAKSKRFFKNGTYRFSSAKATDQLNVARKVILQENAGQRLHSSTSVPSSFSSKNKGLIAESHDWDEEEVSSDDEETKFKALMSLTNKERIFVGKKSARNDLVFVKSNHDTDEVPSNKSQRNTIDPSAVVSDSPAPDYDPADESSVCSTPLLPLKKLDGVEPGSGPKTVKSVLKGNKSSSASKTNSTPTGKLKNVNGEDEPPVSMVLVHCQKTSLVDEAVMISAEAENIAATLNLGLSVDTDNSYEVPHNIYNKAHQRSIDHIDKSHEDPHSGHNKDIVVDDSMNHMDKKYSFHCSPVPTHNEAGTEAGNHNQIENHFHMNHTSKSRMWGVEGGKNREGNRKNSD
nr:hypothetical protein [Tanacetum cinerariifolium]